MTKLNKILIPIFFFIQYLEIGFFAQIFIFLLLLFELGRKKKISISLAENILLIGVLILYVIKLFYIGFENNFLMFKFYYGFILFYFYFKLTEYRFNFLHFFWMTVIVTLVDFILINTIIPIEIVENIHSAHPEEIYTSGSKILFFTRSYGLASIPSASSTIIVVLLAGLYTWQRDDYRDYHILMALASLFCINSGTGLFLFFIFLFFRFKLHKSGKFLWGIITLFLFYYLISKQDIEVAGLFSRISLNYFERLFEYKNEQFAAVLIKLSNSTFETLFGFNYFGTRDILRMFSDFGWIDFLECYGFVGIGLFLLFLILKKKLIYLPIIIILLGTFHYTIIGSIPGQILLAGSLLYTSNKIKKKSL